MAVGLGGKVMGAMVVCSGGVRELERGTARMGVRSGGAKEVVRVLEAGEVVRVFEAWTVGIRIWVGIAGISL